MSKIAYNYLSESPLFHDSNISTGYEKINGEKLSYILEEYRNYILKNKEDILTEISLMDSELKVFSNSGNLPKITLVQSALYIDQFIIDDPLFRSTKHENSMDLAVGSLLGYSKSEISRKDLVSKIKFLKWLTPMVAADYVKLFPASLFFEPPEKIPLFYSKDQFENDLPRELFDYCKKKATVKSMMPNGEGGWIVLNKKKYTSGIYVQLNDSNGKIGMVFHYLDQELTKKPQSNVFEAKMSLAKYPLEPETWNAWVRQSINRTCINAVEKIYTELSISADLNATYITDNKFTSDLIKFNFQTEISPQSTTLNHVLNLNLPIINRIDIGKLMDIRNYDSDIFIRFRIELERQFRELRFVTDPKKLMERKENIFHEFESSQARLITSKLTSLKKKAVFDSSILLGTLSYSVLTSGYGLLATAIAAASGYKTYLDYKESVRESPAFLMWKIIKK